MNVTTKDAELLLKAVDAREAALNRLLREPQRLYGFMTENLRTEICGELEVYVGIRRRLTAARKALERRAERKV
jgi:hypothetical protein